MACHAWPRRSSTVLAGLLIAIASGALVGDSAPAEPVAGEPPAAALPARLPREVERLRGLTAAELARHLGKPDFVRAEPPAVVWQYRSTHCVLDLFLYRSEDEYRIAYAETHDRGLVRVLQSDCYADLVATRARPL